MYILYFSQLLIFDHLKMENNTFKLEAAKQAANRIAKRFNYNTFKIVVTGYIDFMTMLFLHLDLKQLGSIG